MNIELQPDFPLWESVNKFCKIERVIGGNGESVRSQSLLPICVQMQEVQINSCSPTRLPFKLKRERLSSECASAACCPNNTNSPFVRMFLLDRGGGKNTKYALYQDSSLNDPTGAPWWIRTKLQQPSRANVRVKFRLGLRPERHLWREEVLHKHRRWRARTWGSLFSTLAAGALKIHPRSGTFASPPRA